MTPDHFPRSIDGKHAVSSSRDHAPSFSGVAHGSAAAQVALLCAFERYERQERLAGLFPTIECIWKEADHRHQQMLQAALLCGFKPGGEHGHLSTLAWVQRRVGLIERTMPNHAAEARKAA